jgi:hypothetical protein
MSGPIHVKSKDIPRPADQSNTVTSDIQQSINRFISWISQGTEVTSDADNVAGFSRSQLPPGAQVHVGIIHYTIPCYGAYRVALFGLGGLIRCRDGRGAYGGGETELKSLLPPGTHVYVLVQEHSSSLGTIIGVKPQPQTEANDAFSDFVVQGSGVGLYASPYYADYVAGTVDGAGAKPYSGDYPIDGLSGDYTVMATTGVGLHIDDEMAYLRTSELCGLFLFREDGYTRLTGEQLAIESYATRSESGMVAYELYEQVGHSLYPWETLGWPKYGEQLDIVRGGVSTVYTGDRAVIEPPQLDVVPIERIVEYGGYLGQGQLTVLSAPTGDSINTISSPTPSRGLFRSQVMLDGTYLVETARQLYFAKTFAMPVLSRKHARDYFPPDAEYRFSGVTDGGDEHIVKQLEQSDPIAAAMHANEAYAYASAWQGLHAAVYHPYVDLHYGGGTGASQEFSAQAGRSLDASDRVSPPPIDQVSVDHRYGEVDIHKLLSLFAILPDGSIVLRNGLGAEIKLSQGVVEIAGTGIYMHAARTCSVLAGQVAIRSYNSLEMVSSHDAVRIKAEGSLTMLAGNGGAGGVLIESKGVGRQVSWSESDEFDPRFGGVVIKAANSYVATLGGDVILKSGTTAAGLVPGRVVVDAPQSTVTVRATTLHRYVQLAYDHFTSDGTRIDGTSLYSKNFTVLAGSLGVNEQIIGRGGLQLMDSCVSLNGYFGSPLAEEYDYRVGTLEEIDKVRRALELVEKEVESGRREGRTDLQRYNTEYRGDRRCVNDEAIRRTSFRFPSSQQYRATGVKLLQPFWQQIVPPTQRWNEPPVPYGRSVTRPWPGEQRHNDTDGYVELEAGEGYFDPQSQQPIDPTANRKKYEEAKSSATHTTSILAGLKTL